MRRVALLLVALSADAAAEAEHYEQVRVDGGVIGASAAVDDRNGAGFVAEVKVNVHDLVAVGGRVEIAVHFGGDIDGEELPFGMAAAGLVKGEYFVGTGTVRSFAGLGAGVYSMGSHTITDAGVSTTTGRYVGVAPQLGIDLGPVRLAATYNAILGTSVEYRQTSGGIEHRQSFSPSYLSLELSFRVGGGRKPAR